MIINRQKPCATVVGKLYFLFLFIGEPRSVSFNWSRARNTYGKDAFSRGLKVSRLGREQRSI